MTLVRLSDFSAPRRRETHGGYGQPVVQWWIRGAFAFKGNMVWVLTGYPEVVLFRQKLAASRTNVDRSRSFFQAECVFKNLPKLDPTSGLT